MAETIKVYPKGIKVFAEGTLQEIKYKGKNLQVTPVACYGELFTGLGLKKENGEISRWGVFCPQYPLGSYRGMKVLETYLDLLSEEFDPNAVSHSWYVGTGQNYIFDEGDIDDVKNKLEANQLEIILKSFPKNLDQIIEAFRDGEDTENSLYGSLGRELNAELRCFDKKSEQVRQCIKDFKKEV